METRSLLSRAEVPTLGHQELSLPLSTPRSYMLIVVMANALGVIIVMTLHRFGAAAVGAPPVTQVAVDVCGILLTCLVCTAVLGVREPSEIKSTCT